MIEFRRLKGDRSQPGKLAAIAHPSHLKKGVFDMHHTSETKAIATTLFDSNCYRVTIVSDQLELDDREMPVPKDCQTIEVWAKLAENIGALVTISHPGYKVVDSWQPIEIEEECPF
ncbi:MAG: hypothetical protein N4J56_004096 [Chroococcidiopsis sp. SAG 2025]|uniref:hypothetical protein n=1 Tax=Chroococcidiopsis sp. SAG 2025 TaxID=171389 RepID=UPI0029372D46|nr:hypothetical protein [Chroococcidiopsis sp. SAG 2025]MDV2994442.1 hypothetical protein [Chroococcidiopsis sp. SAG 2025]